MIKYYILDDDKNVVEATAEHWALLYENTERRRVAFHDWGEQKVSTVFLGLDHNLSGEGPPLVFETMSFPDEWQERYSTYEEALAGHERRCAELWGARWKRKFDG